MTLFQIGDVDSTSRDEYCEFLAGKKRSWYPAMSRIARPRDISIRPGQSCPRSPDLSIFFVGYRKDRLKPEEWPESGECADKCIRTKPKSTMPEIVAIFLATQLVCLERVHRSQHEMLPDHPSLERPFGFVHR